MTLKPAALDAITAAARDAASEAGAMLLEGLMGPKRIEHKGEVDLVTEHDRRAEELILSRLTQRFPGFGVLAEEGGGRGSSSNTRWIVDPLDGTTNFAHGHPVFAISIGLEHEGALVAGAIAVPALGLVLWAREGGGAFANGMPTRVSERTDLGTALVATGFPYDRRTAKDDNLSEHRAFVKRAQGVRRMGAAAADLALVARGVYDGFWEPRLHPWDIAAGIVIVREAGGRVTDYEGGPPDLTECSIVATNGRVHDEMLAVIRSARVEFCSHFHSTA